MDAQKCCSQTAETKRQKKTPTESWKQPKKNNTLHAGKHLGWAAANSNDCKLLTKNHGGQGKMKQYL